MLKSCKSKDIMLNILLQTILFFFEDHVMKYKQLQVH